MHRFFSPLLRLCTVMSVALPMAAGAAYAVCVDPERSGEPVEVVGVNRYADLALADGRALRLAGVVPIDDAAAVAAIRHHLADGASLVAIAGGPDRWGLHDAQLAVRTGADSKALLLIELLLADGLVLLRPDILTQQSPAQRLLAQQLPGRRRAADGAIGLSAACAAQLAALEQRARRERRGGWGGTAPMPLAATDTRRLKQYEGRFVVVEGRVVSVGERRAATFIDFGTVWSRDFTVIVRRADWLAMEKQGVTAKELEGRTVSVRGDLLLRRVVTGTDRRNTGSAPSITLSTAQGMSILDLD